MSNDNQNKNTVTNSTGKESSNEIPEIAKEQWLDQINKGLLWLNERAWPMAGFMLFVSVLYLFGFIQEEQLPLSIISSSIITALPVIFVLVLLFIGLLVGYLFSPTIMLFSAVKKNNKDRLIDVFVKPGEHKRGRIPKRIVAGWFLIPVTMVLIIGLIGLIFDKVDNAPGWLMTILILLSIPFTVLIFITWVIQEKSLNLRLKDISSDFWVSANISVLPQFLITTHVITLSIGLAQSNDDSYISLGFFVLFGVVVLSGIQLGGAAFVAATRPEQALVRSFITGILVVIVLGIYPPTASKLMGAVLQLTASGGRACAVLTWSPDNPAVTDGVSNPEMSSQSKKLRILIDLDGYYLVRPHGVAGKKVHFIPRDIVSSIDECPK